MAYAKLVMERQWMYNRIDVNTNVVSEEFRQGLTKFMEFAESQPDCVNTGTLFCPCLKCENGKTLKVDLVGKHLYFKGFMHNYYIWRAHGEDYVVSNLTPGSNSTGYDHGSTSHHVGENYDMDNNRYVNMVQDAYNYNHDYGAYNQHDYGAYNQHDYGAYNQHDSSAYDNQHDSSAYDHNQHESNAYDHNDYIAQEPNAESKKFYDMLDAAKKPIYDGCKEGHTPLSLAARFMDIKTDFNMSETCMDRVTATMKEYLPTGNQASGSYYETKKVVGGLGLPYQTIDVCVRNCMLFWKEYEKLQSCRFCGEGRFKLASKDLANPRTGKTKKKTVQLPRKKMWYLPITDRLKRMYQSPKTASAMRWHAEHSSDDDEQIMSHPSDGDAWKHFNRVFSGFAKESRNVYLGLCTDGFKPYGMFGQNYSLWPVILTPYNLPPGMCMKREFLFLTILVPGRDHPHKSLDIFLQPLIEELKELWESGAHAYDISQHENFLMRAALMWTISDFPAYSMLSGWTTHGRLSCPHCMEDTNAFWLKNGRKINWFDCHRRFLPKNHRLRRNKEEFRKNRVVTEDPIPYLNGEEILHERIRQSNVEKTSKVGGNGHEKPVEGYGDWHNWHKESIFWELPYWEDHLLRHNLDVMHIEKNFHDNIMNTILNVRDKTKDNIRSRLDLPLYCDREELHVDVDGKAPVPLFRLSSADGRKAFLGGW